MTNSIDLQEPHGLEVQPIFQPRHKSMKLPQNSLERIVGAKQDKKIFSKYRKSLTNTQINYKFANFVSPMLTQRPVTNQLLPFTQPNLSFVGSSDDAWKHYLK